ncbi:hypothetical protein MTO96_009383 [Rhipicephalus appendiculatus]
MATSSGGKKSTSVLEVLELDYSDGGSSPWFNRRGRSVIGGLTTQPLDADLFAELARDGSMSTLIDFLDTAQPSVSRVALACYILLGLVVLQVFVIIPLAALGLRRYSAKVGLIAWLCCEVLLLVCMIVSLICLLTMIASWYGMHDGLGGKAPDAYDWTFQLLGNYTNVVFRELKKGSSPQVQKKLDLDNATTMNGIKWMAGNISAWEDNYGGHEALKHLLIGWLSIFQMTLLALALTVALAAALLACVTWSRRQKAIEDGEASPVFPALIIMAGALLLFGHVAIALPMIARWLPICVLGETYVCAPYREDAFVVLDDGVARVWPVANRPDPFCRLAPSVLVSECSTKNRTGLMQLPNCSSGDTNKSINAIHHYTEVELLALQKPPVKKRSAFKQTAKKIVGDCYYPYKIFDTDMTSVCPLFTDELLAYWMALVISAIFCMIGALAAAAIAIIFLAIGEEKEAEVVKRVVRKHRTKKRKKKSPPPPEPIHVEVAVPVPVPVMVPRMRRPRPHHHCKTGPEIILISAPGCSHPQPSAPVAVMAAAPLATCPAAATPAVAPLAVPVAASPAVTCHSAQSVAVLGRSPECCGCTGTRRVESSTAFIATSGGVYAPSPNVMLTSPQPAFFSPVLQRSLPLMRRSRTLLPVGFPLMPSTRLVQRVVSVPHSRPTRRVAYATWTGS